MLVAEAAVEIRGLRRLGKSIREIRFLRGGESRWIFFAVARSGDFDGDQAGRCRHLA
jgi:hypothetical protein